MTLPSPDPIPGPYAHAAEEWRDAGWSPLPLPPRAKAPPPDGYTGREGKDPDAQQVAAWISERPDANIGLRMPIGVVGIDVDAYKEVGATSWNELVLRCGPLPVSWLITSRNDGTSGIRLYRVPVGVELRGVAAPGIEILQHHHRYAVTWPSIHPSGELYRLIGPDGADDCPFPTPSELPWLPETWIKALMEVPREPGEAKVREHTGEWSHAVQAAFAEGMAGMVKGSRHDTARDCCLALCRLEALEHPGATPALQALGRWLISAIQDRSTLDEAAKEWGDMLAGARALVASTPSERPSWDELEHDGGQWDPWEMIGQTRPTEPSTDTSSPIVVGASRYKEGGSWILDAPDVAPAVWGEGQEVLWAQGEPLLIVAPPGVGKTTLAGQILAGRLGIVDSVLGWPVKPTEGKVLYLACDRPSQIRRAHARLFREEHRALLNDRLITWEGPPPEDFALHPERLVAMCAEKGCATVFIDSLKDVAVGISEDSVGAGLNRALQTAIADGVEVIGLHHQRKGQNGVKPKTLEDVFGSTWITAGAGSVLLLWGSAGDPIVELVHLKQPVNEIGPMKVEHDNVTGLTSIFRGFDVLTVVRHAGVQGMTAARVTALKLEKAKPTDNEITKTRRTLNSLVGKGLLEAGPHALGGDGGSTGAVYRAKSIDIRDLVMDE